MRLPAYVENCINILKSANFEVYCVGGSVRDMLMGKTPTDYDLTTSATPNEIMSLFERSIPTGIAHGTVTVISDDIPIEITTFRCDGQYLDSRHPENVNFVKNVDEDLLRRDFTVNAIAFDGTHIIDICGGVKDIEKKILRAVGNAEQRFSEDALRILRCFRFCSTLGFSVEKDTLDAAIKLSPTVKNISVERIASELSKLICGENVINCNPLFLSGCLEFLGLSKGEIPICFTRLPKSVAARLVGICEIFGCSASHLANSLKLSNALKDEISKLERLIKSPILKTRQELKLLLCEFGEQSLKTALEIRSVLFSECKDDAALLIDDILNSKEPYKISMLNISGSELMALGLSGKDIGAALERLLMACIEDPEKNRKDTLIDIINKSLK